MYTRVSGLTVGAAGGATLAFTGGHVIPLVVAGFTAIAAGLALLRLTPRRYRVSP
jgi:hypothetical protein